ncbi:MAG: hypothetical protein IPH88_03735 [Bacteroidales bacterium]|nr:hypothetical protein [Bacteroidales bacterium]
MKKHYISILFIFILSLNLSFAQDFVKMNETGIKDKNDCIKQNDNALLCANYLLSGTIKDNSDDYNHLNALQFLFKWMEASPEFSFMIDEPIVKISKSNTTLLGVYMAAMTKFVLENKDKSKDNQQVKYGSFLIFIDYCQDPKNEVKLNKEIKKLIKAKEENTLEDYLK